MIELPADWLRLTVLILMGTALVVSSLIGGYRLSFLVGINPGIGAMGGILAGATALVIWIA